MGRPELPQERVQLGRAPLAAAGHAVAALALPGIVVVVCGVPVETLATLLLREVGVDPAHEFIFTVIFILAPISLADCFSDGLFQSRCFAQKPAVFTPSLVQFSRARCLEM